MTSLLLEPVYWNWFLLGLALTIAEALAPGAFLVWAGVAALCVGLLLVLFPSLGGEWQWLIFALVSAGSVLAWRSYCRRHPPLSDQPALNRRGHRYIGRVFILDAPIVNGQGKIRVDDSIWKVTGEDCPAGVRVRVIGIDGVVLKVEIEQS